MGDQAAWWRTFFSGPVVEFWLAATPPEQTRQEADFVREALGVDPPATLLDVPCGGGRHCRELAARGFEMTGVDVSGEFLDAARSAPVPVPASGTGSGSVAWDHRAMQEIPWTGRFDGAFCLGNSFGYDDDEGNAGFLHAVARALKPGARFVLDTGYVTESLLPALQERGWYEVGDMLVMSRRRYDHVEGRLHVEYVMVTKSGIERRSMSARLYSYREIMGLLDDAGFINPSAYSSLAREPYKLGSGRLIVVAEKSRWIDG